MNIMNRLVCIAEHTITIGCVSPYSGLSRKEKSSVASNESGSKFAPAAVAAEVAWVTATAVTVGNGEILPLSVTFGLAAGPSSSFFMVTEEPATVTAAVEDVGEGIEDAEN